MSKRTVLFRSIAGITLLSSVAQGGLVSYYFDTPSTRSSSISVVSQEVSARAPLGVTKSTEGQSTFTVTTTNESDFTWTGYILSLDPAGDAAFVEGTAGSTKFDTALYPDAWTIEFWAPEVVLPGQVVTLQFDVSIPQHEPYSYSLTQNPIPEPATLVLLAFGTALLLHKRHKGK